MNVTDKVTTTAIRISNDNPVPQKRRKKAVKPDSKKTKLKGTLDEIFGLWKNRDIDLDKIREQQWVRKPE